MKHLEDILREASIEDPLLHEGRWHVTKDAALAGMTAVIEHCATVADGLSKGVSGGPGPLWCAGVMRGSEIVAIEIRKLKS